MSGHLQMDPEKLRGFWSCFMLAPILGGLLAGGFSRAHGWFIYNYNMVDEPEPEPAKGEDETGNDDPAAQDAKDD